MLAVIHHNYNVDLENYRERRIVRRSKRETRANYSESICTHKSVTLQWQKEILEYILKHAEQKKANSEDLVDIVEEFEDLQLDDIDFDLINDDNNENLNYFFDDFFENVL